MERSYGPFRRAFDLGAPVDVDGITAAFAQGVLRVHIGAAKCPRVLRIAAKMPAEYAAGDPTLYAKAVHDSIGMFNGDVLTIRDKLADAGADVDHLIVHAAHRVASDEPPTTVYERRRPSRELKNCAILRSFSRRSLLCGRILPAPPDFGGGGNLPPYPHCHAPRSWQQPSYLLLSNSSWVHQRHDGWFAGSRC